MIGVKILHVELAKHNKQVGLFLPVNLIFLNDNSFS